MVHVGALPGSPGAGRPVRELATEAMREAAALREAGFDAVIVENMHDRPYVNGPHAPATVAAMTAVCAAVRREMGDAFPIGVQILSRGEREAMAVAHATGCQFIRCEAFVFSHVADEGLMADAAAGPLLRDRAALGAGHVKVFADIQKKHASHAITCDLDVAELAKAAEFFLADGVIVTGVATGRPAEEDDVRDARRAVSIPVLVGSGVTPENARGLLQHAHALIVGSWIKKGGVWHAPVDAARARELVAAAR